MSDAAGNRSCSGSTRLQTNSQGGLRQGRRLFFFQKSDTDRSSESQLHATQAFSVTLAIQPEDTHSCSLGDPTTVESELAPPLIRFCSNESPDAPRLHQQSGCFLCASPTATDSSVFSLFIQRLNAVSAFNLTGPRQLLYLLSPGWRPFDTREEFRIRKCCGDSSQRHSICRSTAAASLWASARQKLATAPHCAAPGD